MREHGACLVIAPSLKSLHFKQRHMVMPFIIKTQVAIFHLFTQARLLLLPSTFMLAQIDLTF